MSNQVPYDYLAQINAALGPPKPMGAAPPPAPPVDFVTQLNNQFAQPLPSATIDNSALASGFSLTPPPAAPQMPAPGAPPGAPIGPPPPPGGPIVSQVNAALNAPQGTAPPAAPPVSFLGGGGVVPAHEVDRRGPSLTRAEAESHAVNQGAIEGVRERSMQTAAVEAEQAAGQVRAAYARQEGADFAAAQRNEELQQLQQDFSNSATALAKTQEDPNRFWASRSTGQKISGFISIALGGFLQGARGGSNPGLDIINTQIDRDIKAQEFAYQASRDSTNAKQTAFQMAMQKYGSEDAARAMARASALDAVQAQIAQQAAMWRGTDAANRADMALAALQDQKMQQIAQGITFVQAAKTPRMYTDEYGMPMNETQARAVLNQYREQRFKGQNIGLETAGKLLETEAQAGLKRGEQSDQGASKIATAVQGAGIPDQRALAERARTALRDAPVSFSERFFENPTVHKALYGKEPAEREQAWTAFKSAVLHKLSGAAISPTEQVRFNRQLEGAKDTESRLAAIRDVQASLDEQERTAMAHGDQASQAEYMRRKQSARTGGPGSLHDLPEFKAIK